MMLFNRKFNARVFAGRPATDLMRYDVSILVFRIIATGLCLLFIAVCRWLVKQANSKIFQTFHADTCIFLPTDSVWCSRRLPVFHAWFFARCVW